MVCPQCHHELSEGAQFCVYCGARSASPASDAGASPPSSDAHSSNVASPSSNDSVSNSAPPDPLIGRVLDDRYEIVGIIGEGGMGTVYRARRVALGDEVAVKILHQKFVKDAAAVERFRREARAAARLHHPNIVGIHDFGESHDDGDRRVFIAMELIDGESLRAVLQRELTLQTPRALLLMRDICAGVGAAHRQSIVHRDLKPDNIIRVEHDAYQERETVKVVDFGIAKLRDATDPMAHTLTQAGMIMGTPYYMSPEQCRGESLDVRADVYSLAAILFEMLAGRPPFIAPTMTGIVAKHLTEPPPPLPTRSGVTPALDAVVQRALSKSPEARQADATEFANELKAAMDGVPPAFVSGGAAIPRTVLAANVPPPLPAVVTPPTVVSTPASPHYAPPVFTGAHPQRRVTVAVPERAPRRIGLFIFLFVFIIGLFGVVGVGAWLVLRDGGLAQFLGNGTPSPTPGGNSTTPVDPAVVRTEVAAAVNRWVETTTSRDIEAHINCYASTLDNYYNATNVPASRVRADRTQAFTNYDVINITLANLRVTPESSGDRATATFDKTWDFEGTRRSSGSVQQRLWLRKVNGRWLITGERDLQLYYRNTDETDDDGTDDNINDDDSNNGGDDDIPYASDPGTN